MTAIRAFGLMAGYLLSTGAVSASPPELDSFYPVVVQSGQQVTVQVLGAGLETLKDVQFYEPGIECQSIRVTDEFEAEIVIRAAADRLPGHIPFRLLTSNGYSSLRTMRVVGCPVLPEEERSDSLAAVRVGGQTAVIAGTLENEDRDRYVVALQQGQRLSLAVEAMQLGGPLLDTVLEVFSPDGERLVFADDSAVYRQDPVASVIAPAAGDYTIEIHEAAYRGDESSHYLLYLGDFPKPGVVYPAGGMANSEVSMQLADESAGSDDFQYRMNSIPGDDVVYPKDSAGRSPIGVPVRVSRFGNFDEVEPNNAAASVASTASADLPVAFNGRLSEAGDIDCFQFRAVEETEWKFDAFARRIGSTADVRIAILDSSYQVLAENDDWGSHDSELTFRVPYSGTYFLRVTDALADGGANAVYRVECSEAAAELISFLPRPDRLNQNFQSLSVPQGNRTVAILGVRRIRIQGEATLTASALPAGVTLPPLTIPADRYWFPVVVEASAEAALGGSLTAFEASVETDREAVIGRFRQTVDLITETADRAFVEAHTDRLPIAVTTPVPFRVELDSPTVALPRSGTLGVRVRVIREDGFDAPIRVRWPFIPPGVVCESEMIIGPEDNEIFYILKARQDAALGSWPLVVEAQVDPRGISDEGLPFVSRLVSSAMHSLTVAESPVTGEFPELAGEQGKPVEVTCRISVGEAGLPTLTEAVLEGLPNRITAEPRQFKHTDQSVSFVLTPADDAPLGTFRSLRVRLSGEREGLPVSYVLAAGTTLRVAEPGRILRSQDGRLLSPLEALKAAAAENEIP